MITPKPCPLCGSRILTVDTYGGKASFGCWESEAIEITCHTCNAEFYIPVGITAKEENLSDDEILRLIEIRGLQKWNNRVPIPQKALRMKIQRNHRYKVMQIL